jgi:hypothetical protein
MSSKTEQIPFRSSKYSIEALKAEAERPRKKKGRPKKYNTEEERNTARVQATKRYRHRLRAHAGSQQEIESGPTVDPIDISLRYKTHASEEERIAARAESRANYNNTHREQINFTAIARYHLGKLKPATLY